MLKGTWQIVQGRGSRDEQRGVDQHIDPPILGVDGGKGLARRWFVSVPVKHDHRVSLGTQALRDHFADQACTRG